MSLVSMKEFEITPGKKITTRSPVVKRALQKMGVNRQFNTVDCETVIDPFEFLLACYDANNEYEQRGRK